MITLSPQSLQKFAKNNIYLQALVESQFSVTTEAVSSKEAILRDLMRGAIVCEGKSYSNVSLVEIDRALLKVFGAEGANAIKSHYMQDLAGGIIAGLYAGGMEPLDKNGSERLLFTNLRVLNHTSYPAEAMKDSQVQTCCDIYRDGDFIMLCSAVKSPLRFQLLSDDTEMRFIEIDVETRCHFILSDEGFILTSIELEGRHKKVAERIIKGEFDLFLERDLYPLRPFQKDLFTSLLGFKRRTIRNDGNHNLYRRIIEKLVLFLPNYYSQVELDALNQLVFSEPEQWFSEAFLEKAPLFMRRAILAGSAEHFLEAYNEDYNSKSGYFEKSGVTVYYNPLPRLMQRFIDRICQNPHFAARFTPRQIGQLCNERFNLLKQSVMSSLFLSDSKFLLERWQPVLELSLDHAEYVKGLYQDIRYTTGVACSNRYFGRPDAPGGAIASEISERLKLLSTEAGVRRFGMHEQEIAAFVSMSNVILKDPYHDYFVKERHFFNRCPVSLRLSILMAFCQELIDREASEARIEYSADIELVESATLKEKKIALLKELKKYLGAIRTMPDKEEMKQIINRHADYVTKPGYRSERVHLLVQNLLSYSTTSDNIPSVVVNDGPQV